MLDDREKQESLEVRLKSASGVVQGSILSIRVGNARRQAPLLAGTCLKFPTRRRDANPFKVDVLAPIANGRLLLTPQEDIYNLQLGEMSLELEVSSTKSKIADDAADVSTPGSAAKKADGELAAHKYVERHNLRECLQSLLQSVVVDKPEDPYHYMAEKLCGGRPPKDVEIAAPGQEVKPAGGGGASAARALAASRSQVDTSPNAAEFLPPVRPPAKAANQGPEEVAPCASVSVLQGAEDPYAQAGDTNAAKSTAAKSLVESLTSGELHGHLEEIMKPHLETPACVPESHAASDLGDSRERMATALINCLDSGDLENYLSAVGGCEAPKKGFHERRNSDAPTEASTRPPSASSIRPASAASTRPASASISSTRPTSATTSSGGTRPASAASERPASAKKRASGTVSFASEPGSICEDPQERFTEGKIDDLRDNAATKLLQSLQDGDLDIHLKEILNERNELEGLPKTEQVVNLEASTEGACPMGLAETSVEEKAQKVLQEGLDQGVLDTEVQKSFRKETKTEDKMEEEIAKELFPKETKTEDKIEEEIAKEISRSLKNTKEAGTPKAEETNLSVQKEVATGVSVSVDTQRDLVAKRMIASMEDGSLDAHIKHLICETPPQQVKDVQAKEQQAKEEKATETKETAGKHIVQSKAEESKNEFLSLDDELKKSIGPTNGKVAFAKAREWLTARGLISLKTHLQEQGFVDEAGCLTTTGKPFNLFAMVGAGTFKQPGMEQEQVALGDFASRFAIVCNRTENDEHWESEDPEWVGKASMSKRHRFLTTKDTKWHWFNALVLGLVEDNTGSSLESLEEAISEVKLWKEAALHYTKEMNWEGPIGLYFHAYPYNSVNSLHLHIVDLSAVGPTFKALQYKNLCIDDVLEVLLDEKSTVALNKASRKPPMAEAPLDTYRCADTFPEVQALQEERKRLRDEAAKLFQEKQMLLRLAESNPGDHPPPPPVTELPYHTPRTDKIANDVERLQQEKDELQAEWDRLQLERQKLADDL